MQFYIPPRRARGIWQEYLDRQALEQRNRLEMAKRIMTWYSDLESEVADHFHKALQGSAPKRPRLAADDDGRSSVSLSLPPADGTPDYNRRSWQADTLSPSSLGHRLPSLFPNHPGLPSPTMTYPDYYHYTDEVDPFISDHLAEDLDYPSPSHEEELPLNQTHCEFRDTDCFSSLQFGDHQPHLDPSPPRSTEDEGSWLFHSTQNSHLFTTDHQSLAQAEEFLSPSSSSLPWAEQMHPASSDRDADPLFRSLALDFAICATSDDVIDSEDDIVDTIRLDWTEEEKNELRTIVV